MNTNNLLNFVHSFCLVPADRRNSHPPVLLTQMLQEDGNVKWKISMQSNSSLNVLGFFGIEMSPSNRDKDFLNEHRFNSIEEACASFQHYLNVQTNPNHEFYVANRFMDYANMQNEFNRFLRAAEITI